MDDAGTAAEGPDAGGGVAEAAADELRGKGPSFEGAYGDYFSNVCRGQQAQQLELKRAYCDYLTAIRAAVATHDSEAAVRAQKTFEEESARLSHPARQQESVRDAFATYQRDLGDAFASADLSTLEPGTLEAVGRSISYVATHRIGFGG
jgi:hypothetical protein